MTTVMFWVGLGAMVLGWLTSSLPMVVMGAGIFVPAALIAGIVGILKYRFPLRPSERRTAK